MKIRKKAALAAAVFVALACASCDDDHEVTAPGETFGPAPIMSITEPVIIGYTPTRIDSVVDDYFVFDLNADSMIATGRFEDIEIGYGTISSCDENRWIFNCACDVWVQFSIRDVVFCIEQCDWKVHYLGRDGLNPRDYIDSFHRLRIRPEFIKPWDTAGGYGNTVRGVSINPGYRVIPVPNACAGEYRGLTFDGENYWLAGHPSTLTCISPQGQVLAEVASPSESPRGLAYDGSAFWLTDSDSTVYHVSVDGSELGRFRTIAYCPWGIAWADGSLWVSDYRHWPVSPWLKIDAAASCSAGVAVVIDSIYADGHGWNLAWDGNHFLRSDHHDLYVLTGEGALIEKYPWQVSMVLDMEIVDGVLAVLCEGPPNFHSGCQEIALFRLD